MNESDSHERKDYHISFFRPTTKLAKFNRNLSIILVTVWTVCIFGFQIVLKIIEEPVPEMAYLEYEQVWDQVKNNQANIQEKQIFIKSALSVLGKVTLDPQDKIVLDNAVNKCCFDLLVKDQVSEFQDQVFMFKNTKIGDEDYLVLKKKLGNHAAEIINVPPYSLEAKLIPLALASATSYQIHPIQVDAIMAKYLIHNQSVLTDTVFLGFPFHYFYTAVFLLILFVAICLVYCIATDVSLKKLGIIEE